MSKQKEAILANSLEPGYSIEERLLSLDLYRGLTMFLLIAEYTLIYDHMVSHEFKGTFIASIGTQFHHHPWNGLRFWDLVQPFFMFIVGVALPLSTKKRLERGDSQSRVNKHAVQRALLLLLFGWMLYCIHPGKITFRFQNVLAQLSFTYMVAFLLMKRSFRVQFGFSIFLLSLTELIYRMFPVSGFNQPFTPDHNFGAYVDLLISGELSGGHWVSFNAVPTAAHTIWGVLAGKLLMSSRSSGEKLKLLIISGLIGLIAGYALDPVTPIIKRISTSSFVLVSGGWSLLALAFFYWLIDIKKIHRWSRFLIIVGMNPLFIYLFAESGGGKWLYSIVMPFSNGLMNWAGEAVAGLFTSAVVWFLLWYLCYWLYKHKIFIKI
jgi:predicted acyltransferase